MHQFELDEFAVFDDRVDHARANCLEHGVAGARVSEDVTGARDPDRDAQALGAAKLFEDGVVEEGTGVEQASTRCRFGLSAGAASS